jgi:hypothetical protein
MTNESICRGSILFGRYITKGEDDTEVTLNMDHRLNDLDARFDDFLKDDFIPDA